MKLVLTTDWDWEQLARYSKDITSAFNKLHDRFPDDVDPAHLAKEVMEGTRQMWLVLNDDDTFVTVVLSQIDINPATGSKVMLIPALAGDAGLSAVPLLLEAEGWASEQGCDEVRVYGRDGWERSLSGLGYKREMVTYRKYL